MGYLAYRNAIDLDATTGVVVNSGTITDNTDQEKLLTRQLEDRYVFTKSNPGTITITIDLATLSIVSQISILGLLADAFTISYVKLFLGASDLGVTTPTAIIKDRFIDGDYLVDEHYMLSQSYTCNKVEIRYTDASGGQSSIGNIYAGTYAEFNFKPELTSYSPKDTSTKDRSNGGQVYVNDGVMYNSITTTIPDLTHDEAWGAGTASINDINLVSQTSKPVILIPNSGQGLSVYGTQKTLAKLKPVIKKNGTNWYWSATLNIEEEL